MRLVYPVCCGVDVHKTFLVATIITTTNSVFTNATLMITGGTGSFGSTVLKAAPHN